MADTPAGSPPAPDAPPPPNRLKRGERRLQILQVLAQMLESPHSERITTATLAQRIGVSEAALYRHYASKAQMFEGLIDFIEHSVFTLFNQIAERPLPGREQAQQMVKVVMRFGEQNPGMVRVMVGDALVYEHERLQQRMNHFFDRMESSLKQVLRPETGASLSPSADAALLAGVLTAWTQGRLQRYARSGFRRAPTEQLDAALGVLLA